ncbi:MAG: cell division protein FtsQ/DivIB [Oscillospiraceae bacterium]
MARRRRGVHRKRFGGWNLLWKLATVALAVVAVVMALILFFRVETIRVEGEEQYSEREILQAAGVQAGDNLYLINKARVSERVFSTLPYVRSVLIYREPPSTLVIEVRESAVAGVIITPESGWVINSAGKIMEERPSADIGENAVIDGLTLLNPAVGRTAETDAEQAYRFSELLRLLPELEEQGLLGKVQAIHLGESDALTMEYAERFLVCLPWGADYAYKLQSLEAVIARLEVNETGTIDMLREDGEVHFFP